MTDEEKRAAALNAAVTFKQLYITADPLKIKPTENDLIDSVLGYAKSFEKYIETGEFTFM